MGYTVYILDPNVFLTVLADFLAPDSAGPSADTVMAANASMYFFFFFKVAQAIDDLEYILTEDTTWLQIVHVVSHGVETFQGLNNSWWYNHHQVLMMKTSVMKMHAEGTCEIYILTCMFVQSVWKSIGFYTKPRCMWNLVKIYQSVCGLCMIFHPDRHIHTQKSKQAYMPKCKFHQIMIVRRRSNDSPIVFIIIFFSCICFYCLYQQHTSLHYSFIFTTLVI